MARAPYADGVVGVTQSLSSMVRQIRRDRGNPRVKGWTQNVLGAAGIDGRDRPSVKAQAQAILDALRKRVRYYPDPVGIEFVGETEAILCLTRENCLGGEDCDGITVAFCSAAASVGIQVCIFHQKFGRGQQEHVLGGVQDESGSWLYCDGTLKDAPVGTRAPGVTWEQRIDPFDALAFTGAASIAAETPEIVTFGAVPHVVESTVMMKHYNGSWWAHDGQQWLFHHEGNWQAHGLSSLGSCAVCGKPIGLGPGRGCGGACKAAQSAAKGVGAGIWVYPSDVESEKVRVNAKWLSLSADVDACLAAKKITDAEAHAFYLDRNAWDIYYSGEVSYFGLPSQMVEVNQYEQAVYQWQLKFKKTCVVQAPIVEPNEYKDPTVLPNVVPKDTTDALKTVAVAGAVIAGAVVLIWGGTQIMTAVKAGRGLRPKTSTPKLDARRARLQRA